MPPNTHMFRWENTPESVDSYSIPKFAFPDSEYNALSVSFIFIIPKYIFLKKCYFSTDP